MKKTKIVIFEVNKEEKNYLKSKLKNHKLVFLKSDLNEKNVHFYKDCEIIVIFVNSQINKYILDKMNNLKLIATRSTGFDQIDINECKQRKITVCNVPFYGMNTVAEFTFGLILALSRNIHKTIERTKSDNFNTNGLEGFDLKGKTIGVIGPGHIGKHVMRYAKAFEMKILTTSHHKDEHIEKEFSCKFVTLDKLLKNSDIITIHAPLNKETTHLINLKNINKIKRGAYLINTARGEIVETKALLYALDRNILAGAALDVLEGEEEMKEHTQGRINDLNNKILEENHRLLKKRHVIITPHIAFYTKEALKRIWDTTIDNINAFNKKRPINKVS